MIQRNGSANSTPDEREVTRFHRSAGLLPEENIRRQRDRLCRIARLF
jgi:hypothetical protein